MMIAKGWEIGGKMLQKVYERISFYITLQIIFNPFLSIYEFAIYSKGHPPYELKWAQIVSIALS